MSLGACTTARDALKPTRFLNTCCKQALAELLLLTFDQVLPAACQGVIGIECLNNRQELKAILESVQDPIAKSTTAAERSMVELLNADCQSPVASYAAVESKKITVTGLVASKNGEKVIRETTCGNVRAAKKIGADVANKLLTKGAIELLKDAE